MSNSMEMPKVPEGVPPIARNGYFTVIGLIKKLGLKNQEFEKVDNNEFHFTDYKFFWTPVSYKITPRKHVNTQNIIPLKAETA